MPGQVREGVVSVYPDQPTRICRGSKSNQSQLRESSRKEVASHVDRDLDVDQGLYVVVSAEFYLEMCK